MLTFNALGVDARWARTAGRPAACRCASSIPTSDEVPAGETGEIVARGPTVMNGYWNRPEETRPPPARRLAPHERPRPPRGRRLAHVHRTEDAASSSRPPRTSIRPRSRRALAQHPAVADAAVIGVPDPTVDAVASRRSSCCSDGADATADEIIEHCRDPHRVVQEAAHGRVRRRSSPATASRSTTTPSTRSSAAAATPAGGTGARERRGRRRPSASAIPTARTGDGSAWSPSATALSRAGWRTTSITSRSRCVTIAGE